MTPCFPGASCSLCSHLPLANICRACGAQKPSDCRLPEPQDANFRENHKDANFRDRTLASSQVFDHEWFYGLGEFKTKHARVKVKLTFQRTLDVLRLPETVLLAFERSVRHRN